MLFHLANMFGSSFVNCFILSSELLPGGTQYNQDQNLKSNTLTNWPTYKFANIHRLLTQDSTKRYKPFLNFQRISHWCDETTIYIFVLLLVNSVTPCNFFHLYNRFCVSRPSVFIIPTYPERRVLRDFLLCFNFLSNRNVWKIQFFFSRVNIFSLKFLRGQSTDFFYQIVLKLICVLQKNSHWSRQPMK